MKIYVFVPTGEIRQVKFREWFLLDGIDCQRWENENPSTHKFPILTYHEIEAPNGATEFEYGFRIRGWWCGTNPSIPIFQQKKKIKKWRWAIGDAEGCCMSFTHNTKDEITTFYPKAKWYHCIPETKIEVEE